MFVNRMHKILFLVGLLCTYAVSAQNATLQDYWDGKARWVLDKKINFNAGPEWGFGSSFVRVAGNDWYLFSRTIITGVAGCNNNESFAYAVRKSSDRGNTWSSPVTALAPNDSGASICGATDGDAYYDANANKWRFLYQCIAKSGGWKGCYAERPGSSPLGKFTPVSQNPVIQPNSLWSQICNSTSDKCVQQTTNQVIDEGTFNIFRFDGTFFWISFHGFDDNSKGFRGIAKTKDFLTYYAGGSNGGSGEVTPADAILTQTDATTWREQWQGGGNIGVGHGGIVQENGYYYLLAEFADKNLACITGQNWDFGLFRSSSLSNLSWTQFPLGNPILYSSKELAGDAIACNIQYAQIFKDTSSGDYYLHYYRDDNDWNYRGVYYFKLQKTNNVLKNGDLWMAKDSFWTRLPAAPANLAVYRVPKLSSDGTPILATNCGSTTCAPGQSIYQDVDVTLKRGRPYTFGGQFSVVVGAGSINLTVWQLDASYNVLQQNVVPASLVSGTFTEVNSGGNLSPQLVILNQTKYLRYQFYLGSPAVTYLADNMYLDVN